MVIVEHLAKCGAMGRLKQCPILVMATIFNREALRLGLLTTNVSS